MLIDCNEVAEGGRLEADLCIVGAGPAGITLAREFAGSDVRVCVLESGDLKSSVRTHRLTGGPSVGASYHRLLVSRDRGVGGSSLRFPLSEGWHARAMDPIDFEQRPGVPHSGWPMTRAQLEPYFRRAHVVSDLGPYTYDPSDWESETWGKRLPLDPAVVQTTMFQLGTTHFGRYANELRHLSNVRVVLRATVVDIATDEDPGRVDRVVASRPDGARFSVSARHFVLAAGAIDNARLMLMSNRTHARGLGNQHDLVGRYFMERLSTRSGYIEPAHPGVVDAVEFYVNKPAEGIRIEGALRLNEDLMRSEGLRNCIFFVLRRSRSFTSEGVRSTGTLIRAYRRQPLPEGVLGHLRNVVTGWQDIATTALQRVRGVAPEDMVLLLRAQGEHAPNPDSRVTLDRRRDPLGCPRARLAWRPTADDRESIRHSQELIGDAFRRAGLGNLALSFGDEQPPAMFEGNWHHMGTTRMSPDPKRGVVDADSKVHGLANLFVAGSSVFPTSGASNPTLTLVALTLRLSEHLRVEVLGRPPMPIGTKRSARSPTGRTENDSRFVTEANQGTKR